MRDGQWILRRSFQGLDLGRVLYKSAPVNVKILIAMETRYEITRNITVEANNILNASIWLALARNSSVEYSLKPDFVTNSNRVAIAKWNIKGNKSWRVQIQEVVIKFPSPPKLTPSEYLGLEKDLIVPDKAIKERAESLRSSNVAESVKNITNYLVKSLKYHYPPKSRDAKSVFESKESDCGGYHILFVSMLRCLKIPSVVDFGMRLPKYTPHVWSWYYDKDSNKWQFIDINDIQDNKKDLDRVSYSLGVNPLVKDFPAKVQFLQNRLFWDYNFEHNKVKGTPVLHKNNTKVEKITH